MASAFNDTVLNTTLDNTTLDNTTIEIPTFANTTVRNTTFEVVTYDNVTSLLMDIISTTEAMATNASWNNSFCNASIDSDNCSSNVTAAAGSPYPFPAVVIMGILAAILTIVTILGNLMVIISFVIERQIRQPTNYYIASLALSDLLIGTFSMPLFTIYLLVGYWPFGPWVCDIWLSMDWTVCLASQYTVFAITADRFCSVKIPAKYRNWRTDRKVRVIVAMVWIVPMLIFFITIIGWQYFVGGRTIPPQVCDVAFMQNRLFSLLLNLGYYWITLAVMMCLYAGIYSVALQLQRKSDAKAKKMNSTIGMMCDQLRLGISMTHNNVIQNAEKLDVPKKEEHINNGRANTNNTNNTHNTTAAVTTTSFSTTNSKKEKKEKDQKDKDDDRSSSPCFPSDEENSSQSSSHPRGKSKGGKSTSGSAKSHKKTKKEPGSIEETTKLVKSPSEHLQMSNVPEESQPEFHMKHVSIEEEQTKATTKDDSDANSILLSRVEFQHVTENPLNDEEIIEQNIDPTNTVVNKETFKGNMYIDMDCLKSFISFENIKLIDDISDDDAAPKTDDDDDPRSSPVWKKRASLQDHIKLPVPGHSDVSSISQLTIEINGEKPSTSSDGGAGPTTQVDAITEVSKSVFSQSSSDQATAKCDGITSEHLEPIRTSRLASFVKYVGSRKPKKIRAKREREKGGKSKSENRARKALRTITIILGAFVLCWTPYQIFLLVMAFCPENETCISGHLYNFSYWLCYLNSPINPFCYAFANAQFKRTFIRMLKLDWHRT